MNTLPVNVQKELLAYIEKHKISPEKQKKIIEDVKHAYIRMRYDSEEPMGVVAAQSLSEPATQMTMRTYHFAGIAGIQVTLGLPRMIEIFDARKEPRTPTMSIYLKPEYQDVSQIKKIAEKIKQVKIKDIVISTIIDLAEMTITCKLSKNKIESLEIDTEKLVKKIRIRDVDVKMEGDNLILRSKKEDIKNLHKIKYSLLESHVKGIKGVSQVVVTKNERDEWTISTLGSNLKKVYEIEGVDSNRTTSNNVFEVYDVLGVEAARETIIRQARYTMEEQGLGVDPRYIMLLADLMTVSGDIKAIGRYGISGAKSSVLVRASFEETKKHLVGASIRGEKDELKGTIENIMMNQVAPIGTGAFDLIGRIPESFYAAKKVKADSIEASDEKSAGAKKKPAAKKPAEKAKTAKKTEKPAKKAGKPKK